MSDPISPNDPNNQARSFIASLKNFKMVVEKRASLYMTTLK